MNPDFGWRNGSQDFAGVRVLYIFTERAQHVEFHPGLHSVAAPMLIATSWELRIRATLPRSRLAILLPFILPVFRRETPFPKLINIFRGYISPIFQGIIRHLKLTFHRRVNSR